ncbi:MAG: glycosyltransferase family 4 protein [Chloroflexota bacterium]
MKIAYICADFGIPIFGFKGASVHVREMVTTLQNLGHEVVIFSPRTERVGNNGVQLNVVDVQHPAAFQETLESFKSLDQLFGRKNRFRQDIRNLQYNTTLFEQMRPQLEHGNFDFIYERYTLFNYAGIALARELGIPHILEVNAPLCYEKEKASGIDIKNLAHELEQRIFTDTDHLFVVSTHLQTYAQSLGVPPEQITVLPNGVTMDKFHTARPQQVRQQYGLDDQITIGFVGSLKPWHGTETLVSAFNHISGEEQKSNLLLVGDGPQRPFLAEQVDTAGLTDRVIFTGKVPHAEVPDYAAAMDIAVAPYTPNDNFYFSPMKIFEYMAAGTAVVAAAIGQVKEAVQHGETGLLYEPGNIEDLTNCLQYLIRNEAVRRQLGKAGRSWVQQNQTWEQNAATVLEAARKAQQKSFAQELYPL